MANQVYANNMEVSCKASNGKSICAFPDVCFTPPLTPATPPGVPIPYPNTAFASDTSDGSSTVKITDQEIMLKNKSYFKQSTGDEAGSAPKKNVITSQIKGKAYFIAWSMDVKVEGENVVRHMDMTTHNHGSMPAGAPPTLHAAMMAAAKSSDCHDNLIEINRECSPWTQGRGCPEEQEEAIRRAETKRDTARAASGRDKPPYGDAYDKAQNAVRSQYLAYTYQINKDPCRKALKCLLMSYKEMEDIKCAKQTGEHLIEKASCAGVGDYNMNNAPTAFTEGPSNHLGEHGIVSLDRKQFMENWAKDNDPADWTVESAADLGASVFHEQNPDCDRECLKQQIIAGHEKMDMKSDDTIRLSSAASEKSAPDREIMKLVREQLSED
jgi:hypothetical protein